MLEKIGFNISAIFIITTITIITIICIFKERFGIAEIPSINIKRQYPLKVNNEISLYGKIKEVL